ncbi:MAG: ribose 1,5-bisphosphate isomerase, partial [Methanomicrobiales archaeon]|nr:ribose 1,5-bisphosphate isomerase [Methanomicrobiales archaeon]
MIVPETAEKIKSMEIRGAGRIARAVAGALSDHARDLNTPSYEAFRKEMVTAAETLVATRPTAVSLPNAVHIVMNGLDKATTLKEARSGIIRRAEDFITSSTQAV